MAIRVDSGNDRLHIAVDTAWSPFWGTLKATLRATSISSNEFGHINHLRNLPIKEIVKCVEGWKTKMEKYNKIVNSPHYHMNFCGPPAKQQKAKSCINLRATWYAYVCVSGACGTTKGKAKRVNTQSWTQQCGAAGVECINFHKFLGYARTLIYMIFLVMC